MTWARGQFGSLAIGGAICLVALLWRVSYVIQLGQSPLFGVPLGAVETSVLSALGFAGDQILGIKWVQAVLGTVNCLLVWRLGQVFFGQPTGVVAGLMAVFYGPFIYYGGQLGAGVWAIFFAMGGLVSLMARPSYAGLTGLLLGVACALTGQVILLTLVALWWLASRAGWGRFALMLAAGWAVGFLAAVWWLGDSPWPPETSFSSGAWPAMLYRFWHGGEWTGQSDPYLTVEGTAVAALLWERGLAFPFGLIGPLALLGLYGLWRIRDPAPEISLALWGCGAGIAGALFYGGDADARIVAVPLLLVMAAQTLVGWWRLWSDQRFLALQAGGLAVLVLALNWGGDVLKDRGTANERYRRGLAYEGLAMKANAIREYERSVASAAAPVVAHAALGRLYKEDGEYARSIGAYRAVLRRSPVGGSAREELAQACLLAERPREAAAEYRILSEGGPDGDRFLGRLGDARLMAGDASGATAAYRQMVTAHPDSIRVLYHLARLYESEGFKEEALAAYRRLQAAGPWRAEARWRAAALLAERGEVEEAERLLRAVLAAEVDNSPALWGLGRLLAVGGRYGQALPLFERLRDMDPQDYRPYFFLSKLYFRLQREEEAERAYEKYQIAKRQAEMKQSAEENLDAVLRQFGELGE